MWVVIDFKPTYSVSNFGRVRNNSRGKILKPWRLNNSKGHLCISLGRKNKFLIHRLVAYCFLGLKIENTDDLVCHKNDVATHNFVWNLYIGNKSTNQYDYNRLRIERGEKHPNKKK